MNLNENIRNERNIAEKSRGCTYKMTRIAIAKCHRVNIWFELMFRHGMFTK